MRIWTKWKVEVGYQVVDQVEEQGEDESSTVVVGPTQFRSGECSMVTLTPWDVRIKSRLPY